MSECPQMSANVSLSPKQEKLIASLLAPNSIVEAARIAGINERTAHRWFKEPDFQQAYKVAQKRMFEDALDELKVDMSVTIAAMRKHRDAVVEVTAASQIAAIRLWLETGIAIHRSEELEARITELEEALRENKP